MLWREEWVTYAVGIFTWVMIASRHFAPLPIGRPSAAVLGAVLLVVSGAMKPSAAYAAVNGDTIVLLFVTNG